MHAGNRRPRELRQMFPPSGPGLVQGNLQVGPHQTGGSRRPLHVSVLGSKSLELHLPRENIRNSGEVGARNRS